MMNPENFNLCQWFEDYILNSNTRTKKLIKVKRIDNEFFRIKYGGEVVIVGIKYYKNKEQLKSEKDKEGK